MTTETKKSAGKSVGARTSSFPRDIPVLQEAMKTVIEESVVAPPAAPPKLTHDIPPGSQYTLKPGPLYVVSVNKDAVMRNREFGGNEPVFVIGQLDEESGIVRYFDAACRVTVLGRADLVQSSDQPVRAEVGCGPIQGLVATFQTRDGLSYIN